MRKYILPVLLLLSATSLFAEDRLARGFSTMLVGGAAPAGASMNAVNMSRGFEVDPSSRTDSASWTITDTASLIDNLATAQKHSGTYSMSILGNSTTEATQRYDTGATRTPISISLWFYAPSSSSGDDMIRAVQFGASSTGTLGCRVNWQKTSGAYRFVLSAAYDNGVATIFTGANRTANAWYRMEILFTQNGTTSVTIYDEANALLEQISAQRGLNNASRYLIIGKWSNATTGWGTLYYDELGIDYNDATTPLSPFAVTD